MAANAPTEPFRSAPRPGLVSALSNALGNVLAGLSLVLSLCYPLAFVAQDIGVAISTVKHPLPYVPYLAFIYSAVDYFGLPTLAFSALLGLVALALHPRRRPWAVLALKINGIWLLVLLALLLVILLLMGLSTLLHVGGY